MPYQVIQANSPEHYAECEKLLALQYEKHGIPHHGESPWVALGSVQRLMLARDGRILGSVDIIADTPPIGLPLDAYYPIEMAVLRADHGKIFEVGAFATEGLNSPEMDALLEEVGRRLFYGPGDLAVCGIHPKRAKLYRIFFGFNVAAEPKHLPDCEVGVVLTVLTRETFAWSSLGRRMLKTKY